MKFVINNNMEFKIRKAILNETDKCGEKFSCLSGKNECLCEVEDSLDNKIIFIKPIHDNLCDYRMSFGYSHVCNCPTRKEIYKLYNQ
jgi:hypothetical protein